MDKTMKESPQTVFGNAITINIRHKQAIEKGLYHIEEAVNGIRDGAYPELIAVDLQDGMSYLHEVIGVNVKTDILDKIFENFCVGK